MPDRSAVLAMYSLAALRPSYDRLWDALVELVPELPTALTWPDDVDAAWTDPAVVVTQTCGWPLVTRLAGTVDVIGAFEYDVPAAEGHRYRSSIVAARPGRPEHFASARAAYNSTDSLSGWVSLLAWSGRTEASLLAQATATGSHIASLDALRHGRADIASIDSVTLAHVRRHRADLVAGLHEIGHGPLVPSLPIVTRVADDGLVDRMRTALTTVVGASALQPACRELLITGFQPLDLEAYRRDLAPLGFNR